MIILNEISQRKINIICYPLNVEAEKIMQMILFT